MISQLGKLSGVMCWTVPLYEVDKRESASYGIHRTRNEGRYA
jgi:hypothetical protein